MKLQRDTNGISWAQVVELMKNVGWDDRDLEQVRQAFAKSTHKVFAFINDDLVGFGRTVDDGIYYAAIVDVVVAPAQQRKGIGTAIVMDLQVRLAGFLIVTLTAAPHLAPFYRSLGWLPQKTAFLLPRSDEQARRLCDVPQDI